MIFLYMYWWIIFSNCMFGEFIYVIGIVVEGNWLNYIKDMFFEFILIVWYIYRLCVILWVFFKSDVFYFCVFVYFLLFFVISVGYFNYFKLMICKKKKKKLMMWYDNCVCFLIIFVCIYIFFVCFLIRIDLDIWILKSNFLLIWICFVLFCKYIFMKWCL